MPITLDGDEHTAEVHLEVVAHHLVEGARVTLQLVATTPAYATPRLGGELTVTDVALELPTTCRLRPTIESSSRGCREEPVHARGEEGLHRLSVQPRSFRP